MITTRYKDLIQSLIHNFKSLYENQTTADFFHATGNLLAVILFTIALFAVFFTIVIIFLIMVRLISEHIDKTSDYVKMSRTINLFAYLLRALQHDTVIIIDSKDNLYRFDKNAVRFIADRLNDLINNLDENSQIATEFKHTLNSMTSSESDKELNATYLSYDSLKDSNTYHAINKLLITFEDDICAAHVIYSYNCSDYQYFIEYYANSRRNCQNLNNIVASTKNLKRTHLNILHINWYNNFYSLRKGICLAAFFTVYSTLLVLFMMFVY